MVAIDLAAVASGAVAGALLRYGCSNLQVKYKVQPWGIAGVNVAGSFILGAVSASAGLSPPVKLMLATGFCGSFTTFSTFSVDTVNLINAGKAPQALGYAMANNVGGFVAAAAGMWLFRGRAGGAFVPPSLSSSSTLAIKAPQQRVPSGAASTTSTTPSTTSAKSTSSPVSHPPPAKVA